MKPAFFLLLFAITTIPPKTHAQWVQKVSGTNLDLLDLHFATPAAGYAVGEAGTVLKTTDAGETWNALSINTTENLYAVHFIDESKGFVAGDSHLFRTVDGGESWQEVQLPAGNFFRDIHFLDNETGFCAGGEGLILKSTDAGDTWTPTANFGQGALNSIHFPTPQTGYAVGGGYNWGFLKTEDGGDTWAHYPINTPQISTSVLEAVFFTEAGKGFIGGWYLSTLIATSDGGDTWAFLDDSGTPQIYSIYFPSASHGYAVGWYGQIFSTTDGGDTWEMQTHGNSVFYAVHFTSESAGFIVGSGGVILKTDNGGVTAQSEIIAGSLPLKVYPNPAPGTINVDLSAYANRPVRLELYDLQGKLLKVVETGIMETTAWLIDLSAFPDGLYLLRAKSEGLPDAATRIALAGGW